MKKLFSILLSFILILSFMPVFCAAATGNTYYVSPQGADTNPGTAELPWKTMAKAAKTLTAGDTAVFEDGTYNETEYTNFLYEGTADSPITLKARNKHKAIIVYDEALRLEKLSLLKSYINIRDFAITQARPSTADDASPTRDILLLCGNKNMDIKGCEITGNKFYNVYEEGIKVKYARNILVKDNVIENPAHEGMDIFGCDAVTICGNEVYNSGRKGILLKGNTRNCLVYNNYVENDAATAMHGYSIGDASDATSPYVTAENVGYEVYNCVFYNNIAYAKETGKIKTGFNFSGALDCHAYNNISDGATNGFSFSSATNSNSGWAWNPPTQNPALYNNIVVNGTNAYNDIDVPAGRVSDYNLFYNITNEASIPQETNSIKADPKFSEGWKLSNASPASKAGKTIPAEVDAYDGIEGVDEIDAGRMVEINLVDYAGEERATPWDMGVYNRGKSETIELLAETFDDYKVGALNEDNGGWSTQSNKFINANVVSEEGNTNKYLSFERTSSESGTYGIFKPFKNEEISSGKVSFSLKIRQDENAEDSVFYMHFINPGSNKYSFNSKDYIYLNYKKGNVTAWWAIDESNALWHDYEFVIDLDNKEYMAYYEGEQMSYASGKNSPKTITNTPTFLHTLALSSKNDTTGPFYIDDVMAYLIGDLDVLSIEPTEDGDLSKAVVKFNNNLTNGVFTEDKILVDGGNIAVESVERAEGSRKEYIISFSEELSPETTYDIELNGLTDLYGGAIETGSYSFTTRDRRFEFGELKLYTNYGTGEQAEALALADGEITAAFDIVNERLSPVNANLIMVHKRDGVVLAIKAVDATVPKETTETKKISLTLSGVQPQDTLETYLWESIKSLKPIKPAKILGVSGVSEIELKSIKLISADVKATITESAANSGKMVLSGSVQPDKDGTITAYSLKPGYSLDKLTLANFKNAIDFIAQSNTNEDGSFQLEYKITGASNGDEYKVYVGGNDIKTPKEDSIVFFASDFLEAVTKAVNNASDTELLNMLKEENAEPVKDGVLLNTILKLDLSDYYSLKDYTETENYKSEFLKAMEDTEFKDIEDIRIKFCDEVENKLAEQDEYLELLEKINKAGWGELEKIFEDNNSLINLDFEGSFAEIEDDDELKEKLYKQLVRINFENFDELREAFSEEAEKLIPDTPKKSSSGGGGGGGTKISGAISAGTSLTPIVSETQTVAKTTEFSDLDTVAWAKEAIEGLAKENIISGVGDGLFAPDMKVTREQYVKMIVLAFDLYDEEAEVPEFIDMGINEWYEDYIASAVKCGIIYGVDSKHFGVGKEITRAEMAVILYRASKYTQKELSVNAENLEYQDKDEIPDYAYESIMSISKAGVMSGVGDNRFAPHEKATRAMAAKVIWLMRGEK